MPDEHAKKVIKLYEASKEMRHNFDSQFEDIRKLVRPDTLRFNSGVNVPGQDNYDHVYDGTAKDAAQELAAGLISHIVNPADRFFDLTINEKEELKFDHQSLLWLDQVSQQIYDQYSIEEGRFNMAMDEAFLDLVAFGTTVIFNYWSPKRQHLMFRTYPLAACTLLEDDDEMVDTVFRVMARTYSQLVKQFGENGITPDIKKSAQENPQKKFTILHAVMPRIDRKLNKLTAENKPFASDWICIETKETLMKSGFDQFPYLTPRWRKYADEVYGRSPAMTCIDDVKMLNKFEYLLLKAGTKAIDPALLVPNDGFILPIRSAPGSINYKEPDAGNIEMLPMSDKLPFSEEKAQQKREFIRKCFHSDWLRMEKQNVEMTAYEVQDRREEKLRLLAPSLSRIEMELLSKMITFSYNTLAQKDYIPEAPPNLDGRKLKIEYTSPASKAQLGIKVVAMDRYIQRLLPLSDRNPEIMDNLDVDAYAQELSIYQGTPRKIVRDPKVRDQIRGDRQEQEQMAQVAQLAEPATKSIKNLADAQQAGGIPL